MGDAQVDDFAFARNAFAVEDVEHRFLEGRRDFVFHHFAAGFRADDRIGLLDLPDAANVDAHRRIKLQRVAAGGGFRVAEHDANLHANLVDEDDHRVGALDVGGQLAQRLAHQAGLQAGKLVAHVAFNFSFRGERGHRVDDDNIHAARAHQHVSDFQRLFAGIGLGDEQIFDIDAEFFRVAYVQRVLGVDKRRRATRLLHLGDDVQRQRGFAGRFRPIDFHYAPARQPAQAEGNIQPERAGRDGLNIAFHRAIAHAHDGAFAKLLFNLGERRSQRGGLVVFFRHRFACLLNGVGNYGTEFAFGERSGRRARPVWRQRDEADFAHTGALGAGERLGDGLIAGIAVGVYVQFGLLASLRQRVQACVERLGADALVVPPQAAVGLNGQHHRFGRRMVGGRIGVWQVDVDGVGHQRCGDDEDNQQHQHHVDERHHVDFPHRAVRAVL